MAEIVFGIKTELDATGIEKGSRRSVSAAETLQQKFEGLIKTFKNFGQNIQSVFNLLQKIKNIKLPSFKNVDEKSVGVLRELVKLRTTELKLIQEKNKNELEASRSSNRLAETDARHKARMAEMAARSRIQADNNYFRAAEAQNRRNFSEYQRLEREKTKIAQAENTRRSSLANTGQSIRSLGLGFSASVTAPLLLGAHFAVDAEKKVDDYRNAFTALEGSVTAADAKIQSLVNFSRTNIGVLPSMALSGYRQFKALGDASDETLNKLIAGIGKLNTFKRIEDPTKFNENLVQIFTQDFNSRDIKEAVRATPIFREILQQAFGTSDGQALKDLKTSGKLTYESYLKGLGEAIENNSKLKGLGESLGTRIAKTFELLEFALAPVGKRIGEILEPVLNYGTSIVEKLSAAFVALSPYTQTLIVGFVALVGALGPIMVILPTIITFFGTIGGAVMALVASLGTAGLLGTLGAVGGFITGTLLPAIAPVVVGIVAVTAAIAGAAAVGVILYEAWVTDFGGIKTYTLEAFQAIRKIISEGMDWISKYVSEIGDGIVAWWVENYPLIEKTIIKASNNMKATIQATLDYIRAFWQAHGETITGYVQTIWGYISKIISSSMTVIGDFIRLGLQLLNKDWDGAWETLLNIAQNGAYLTTTVFKGLGEGFLVILKNLIPFAAEYGLKLWLTMQEWSAKIVVGVVWIFATLPQRLIEIIPSLIKAGMLIGQAIYQGTKKALSGAAASGSGNLGNLTPLESISGGVGINLSGNVKESTNAVETSGESKGKHKSPADNEFRLHKDAQDVFNRFNNLIQTEPEFLVKLDEISERLNTQPEWILNVLAIESRLRPDAKNPNSSATALLQFMDNGRSRKDGIYEYGGLRLTRNQLANLSATQQLPLIYDYLAPFKNRLTSQAAVYAAVASGKIAADDTVLFTKGSDGYKANRSWDKNHDNRITQGELGQLASQFGFGTQFKLPNKKQVEDLERGAEIQQIIAASTDQKSFAKNLLGLGRKNLTPADGEITTNTISTRQLDAQSKYILGLQESYRINERSQTLSDRQLYYWVEIGAKIEDYNLSLKEQMQDLKVEAEVLRARNISEEASIEFAKQRNNQTRAFGDVERDLMVLRQQNADVEFVASRRRLSAAQEQFSLEQEISRLQDDLANSGINDSLKITVAHLRDVLELRDRELNAVISINKSQLELSQQTQISANQIRAQVMESLAQAKTLNQTIAEGLVKIGESTTNALNSKLGKLGNIPLIGDILKFGNQQIGQSITTKLLDTLFPKFNELTKTDNPIAKPIVSEQQKTNDWLSKIHSSLNKPLLGGSGGGGGAGGAGGSGGVAFNSIADIINFARGAGQGNLSTSGELMNKITLRGGETFTAGQGNILDKLKGLFGKGGSAWGKDGFGFNSGTIQGIGGLAGAAGSIIGGGAGDVLGGVSQGIGAASALSSILGISALGGPIGLAIGGAIGGTLGLVKWLFGKKKQEKKDRNENLPQLQKGFTDALAQFRDLIAHPTDNALDQANQIRSQIATGFGVQFASKKYQKESQKLIAAQLNEIDKVPDGLMEQLKASLNRMREAKEFSNRFVATFASGVWMDNGFSSQYGDFKRRNGMMPGGWNGKDHIPALIANQEMVLNPYQQNAVRRAAGWDVFGAANIPNYPNRPMQMAVGGYVGSTTNVVNNQSIAPVINFSGMKLVLQNFQPLPDAKAYLETPDGKKHVIDIVGENIDNSNGNTGLPRKINEANNKK